MNFQKYIVATVGGFIELGILSVTSEKAQQYGKVLTGEGV